MDGGFHFILGFAMRRGSIIYTLPKIKIGLWTPCRLSGGGPPAAGFVSLGIDGAYDHARRCMGMRGVVRDQYGVGNLVSVLVCLCATL